MSARMLATILVAMISVIVIGGIFLCVLPWDRMTDIAGQIIMDSTVAFIMLWLMVLFFVPARCNKPECHKRMRRFWVKEPDYQFRLQFICDKCGDVYDTNITVGLGEPGSW